MFSTTDTIVAIATAPGRGGIGVVRLGGPASVRIAQALTGRADAFEPRHASLTRIVDPGAQTRDGSMGHLDEVVVTWFQAPHSYTGDDVVEISGHGSPVVLQRIVELAMQAGARLAEPGEFTLRAYLNGRLDLAQAEAVADLVDAVTPLQARAAMDQLEGTLTGAITRIDSSLFDLAARLEASLDFPDEGFHFVTRDDARRELTRIRSALGELEVEGRAGRVIREGRIVAIVGPPNAGKSSLFNALVGSARAIVTPVPGTTRDLLTERVDIGGLAVTLVDTAGLREAADVIEAEGVARAEQTRRIAALTLVLLDGSVAQSTADWRIVCETPEPKIVVWNKSDLPHFSMPEPDRRAGEPSSDRSRTAVAIDTEVAVSDIAVPEFTVSVAVSAITGHGLPELKASVQHLLAGRDEWRDTPAISNVRHLDLVERAGLALDRAIGALGAGATEELALDDIGTAREALEAITGRRTPDDVLRHIFSKFCVGK